MKVAGQIDEEREKEKRREEKRRERERERRKSLTAPFRKVTVLSICLLLVMEDCCRLVGSESGVLLSSMLFLKGT